MLEKRKTQGLGMTSLRTRQRLIERLTEKGIKDVRVLEAMRDTPRHLFLDEALASRAYEDLALPIGYQQTISQPYIVARMTEILIEDKKLEAQPIEKALEVGTGCGYQAAILSRFSKSVHSLERIKALHDKAAMNLKNLKIRNVRLLFDDGSNFRDSSENYDAILFAAAPLEVPSYFLDKLNVGGRLVAPIGDGEVQDLSLIKKLGKDKYETEVVEKVLFVPFLGGIVE
ncbi:MAG TPA: protein-L-isoaspartate(D-aspartate) O-methyltransferase [Gammaproteobacteria bacterium]|jgi:protein-L-isoaspartate(D-aspartate) O-methyltransferase|nr:protein-L-isoaspartate(D-aspartate) O-methyltransferase [Gammaproteobacteria bacterium]HIN74152.1 protein-L-isoaspartate(D-aspartate) O-methyltransferase [Gammaproteobacteria bacterium]|tara:strand:- start:743 stop:1429 length:687 start_codon:yes stop_codon:yes gene_type:complete